MRLVRERFLSKNKAVANYYQDADTVNGDSLPWLEETAGEPFFTVIHYMDPHDPYFEIPYNGNAVARVETPHPDGARAEELRDLYIQNIEYFDGFLVRLTDALKKNDLYDNTVIAFTSDHGEEFYEHEGWWHGTTLYEEQIHVPLIVKLPKGARAGSREGDLARLLDVAPTIAGAAGVSSPSEWQGRDLFGDERAPAAVYAEEDHEGNILESIRTADWKLVTANEGNPRGLDTVALYDLNSDPGEMKNVAADNPDQVAKLKGDLEALRTMAGASAVSGVTGEIDEAATERLRALGYVD
jgi:arylsulfatase A-like enzyme